MADPFQPRFVDLVRNFTSTQGTGNFVLGPAVNGYTSLSSALQPGDSFYYSAIGVDKPNEHEVGRGTLLANGNVSRSPISGGLTNFSNGTKSVALIAAAEWFSKIEAGGTGGSTPVAATRAALAAVPGSRAVALLSEAGREGLFVWDESNLSSKVAADTAQAIHVPPASDTTGASGAWVRQFKGPLVFDWFGAVPGDYTGGPSADCLAAWNALQSFLVATKRNSVLGGMAGARQICFPGAQYYFSNTIQLKVTVRLTGMGVGQPGGWPTTLRFAADKAGIVINESYTNGDAQQSPPTTSAAGTIIEGINFVSDGGNPNGTLTDDLLKSGIRLRTRAVVRDCRVSNFRGAGICISAAVGDGSDPYHGNCNNWRVDTVRLEGCRAGGLFVSGGDANAGVATMVDATACGRFGIYDGAFLGNTHVASHTDSNGAWATFGGIAMGGTVHRTGRRYALMPGATHATAIATIPGTNSAVWKDVGSGGIDATHPDWSTAPVNTIFMPAGSYGHNGSANASLFLGCYYETNQQAPMIGTAGTVITGFMGSGTADGGSFVKSDGNGLLSQRALHQDTTFSDASVVSHALGGNSAAQAMATGHTDIVSWYSSQADISASGIGSSLAQEKATMDLVFMPAQSGAIGFPKPFRLTGPSTVMTYGRVGADNRFITEILNLALGDGNSARVITTGSAPPASGHHSSGELVIHNGPSLGSSPIGWRCIAPGTPGTWEPFLGHGGSGLVYTKGSDNAGVSGAVTALQYDSGSSKGQVYAHDFSAGQYRGLQLQSSGLTVEVGASFPPTVIATFDGNGVNLASGKALKVNGTTVVDGSGNVAASRVTGLAAIATSGSGADVASSSITYAKIQNISASARLLGRASAGAGTVEELGLSGGLTISGTNLGLGAITPTSTVVSGAIKSTDATGGIGYASGAGGAVTQATNKSTGVTLNKASGQITTHNASMAAAALVSFTVTNSAVAATDTINLNLASGNATAGTYRYWVEGIAGGSFKIVIENRSGGALSEALVFTFALVKAVNA